MFREPDVKLQAYLKRIISTVLLLIFLPMCNTAYGSRGDEISANGGYNVILVFIDALRADYVGAYGYGRNTTPNLDRLAAEGIVFENHFTPYTITIGSFMSMITGLYPDSHGVRYVAKDVLAEKIKTLAQILNENGYLTAWYGPENDPHLAPEIGFGRGFDTLATFPTDLPKGRSLIEGYLEKNKHEKFFLNFHTYKVHDPYFPAENFMKGLVSVSTDFGLPRTQQELEEACIESIRNEDAQDGKNVVRKTLGPDILSEIFSKGILERDFPENKNLLMRYLKEKRITYKWDELIDWEYKRSVQCSNGEMISYLKSLYDAEILELDTEIIGPLIRKLKELGIYKDTIIIVTADHGDEFCEHGGLGHGETPYDEVIRVPLIIRFPLQGDIRKIGDLTMTIDLMPTILDVLRIDIPEYVQGVSLKSTILGQNQAPLREFFIANYPSQHLTYRDKEWKLVVSGNGGRQMFNLAVDPAEQKNVYVNHLDLAIELEDRLWEWQASLPFYGLDRPFLPYIDESAREKIRKTGYW